MRTPSGSSRLQVRAHSARSSSSVSFESSGLFDTVTRFQTLRLRAPTFCSPVSGSMTGMRCPCSSRANSLRLFAAHRPVVGLMRRLATMMCACGLFPALSSWIA